LPPSGDLDAGKGPAPAAPGPSVDRVPAPRGRGAFAFGATALIGYVALVTWLTWPLGAQLASHLPATRDACRYDSLYMGWVLAHETHVLLTAPTHLLDTNIYYPARRTLFYGDTGFGALPYFMPVMLASGNPTLALNVLFLGSIALSAWALHLVVARWTGSQAGGFIAACTLLGTRWVLWEFVPTAPSYSLLQYFPFIILLASLPATTFRAAAPLLGLVVLQSLTDVVYVASAVLGPLGVLAVLRLARRRTRGAGLRLLAVLALALLILSPIYAGHLAVRAENPRLGQQTVWIFSSYATTLPWGPFQLGPTAVPLTCLVLIALGAVVALARMARKNARAAASPEMASLGRAWLHGAFWTCVAVFLALGPNANWDGGKIKLPEAYLNQWLPIYRVLRVPSRLGVAALMGLAILAGVAFAEFERCIRSRVRSRSLARVATTGLAALVAVAIYWNYAAEFGQLFFRRTPLPREYRIARAATLDPTLLALVRRNSGPLLELPVPRVPFALLPGDSPAQQARAMYRSIHHWRPLLNGYDSYWPVGFPERMALASRLPEAQALDELRRETGLKTILVHAAEMSAEQRAAWVGVAEGSRPEIEIAGREGDDLLFEVGEEPR